MNPELTIENDYDNNYYLELLGENSDIDGFPFTDTEVFDN